MSAATVTDLQRELLAVCKGGRFFSTWAEIRAEIAEQNRRAA